jgi:N-acetylmuramoyl-L-alanine amidase
LADPLRKVFSDEGFTFSENVSKADYVITIDANTREGGTSSGFHVAYLDVNWSLTAKSGSVLLQNSESNIKGLQLNFEAAGLDAYRKGSLQMEKEVSKKILEAIF